MSCVLIYKLDELSYEVVDLVYMINQINYSVEVQFTN